MPAAAHTSEAPSSTTASRAVAHTVQMKVVIGQVDDSFEREADAVADRVEAGQPVPSISMLSAGGLNTAAQRQALEEEEPVQRQVEEEEPVQAKCAECEEEESVQRMEEEELVQPLALQRQVEEEELLQTKREGSSGSGGPSSMTAVAGHAIQSKGPGAPMQQRTRHVLESSMGTDLSGVRVHSDGASQAAAGGINARAFTHKNHIWLGRGESQDNLRLMAHETTHVLQQDGVVRRAPLPVEETREEESRAPSARRNGRRESPATSARAAMEAKPLRAPGTPETSEQKAGDVGMSGDGTLHSVVVAVPAQVAPVSPEADIRAPVESEAAPEAGVAEEEASAEAIPAEESGTAAKSGDAAGEKAAAGDKAVGEEDAQEKPEKNADAPKADGEAGPAEGAEATGAKAPTSPEEDPAFQAVVKRAKATGKQQRAHAPAAAKASEAQASAVGPPNEVASQAAGKHVGKMDAQEPAPFDRAGFKASLVEKIKAITPKKLKEVDDFEASSIKGAVISKVAQGKEAAQGPIKKTTEESPDTSGLQPKPVTALPPTEAGPPPGSIGAARAAPKPKTAAEVSGPLDADSRRLDEQMADADVTSEQLSQSNESTFQAAQGAKEQAQTHAREAPAAYRQDEQAILEGAQAGAIGGAEKQTQAMHGARQDLLAQVVGGQDTAKTADEQKRAEVSTRIEAIYTTTKQEVEARLSKLDEDVNQIFDRGAELARRVFERHVEREMDAYKDRRYSGLRGKYRWLKDKIRGMPSAVNRFYREGRDLYISEMDAVIDRVAEAVETGLAEAKGLITTGRKEVQEYVESLPKNLKQVGQDAAQGIQDKFDSLEQSVKDKADQLIDSLAQKYVDNLNKVDARIEEMKAANRGLVDKAFDAVVGVIKAILQLKDMLLGVLARAAAVIGLIIKDPIGFLGNLVGAVKLGLKNFIANIGTHLQKGLMAWLFGALAEAGIQIPEKFDLKGILSLVLQILGLTYANIRARAVKILGEKIVSRLEQVAEIFKILLTEGPGGLWRFIKEKVGDLKTMVIGGIKDFVITKIITAGITWILSLLNPASAFIKAAKAIYDIVMFFVKRASQIATLVNAILDSITAIAKGSLSAAAKAVENALAKAIPVVIGFLASLLGVGGISDKIREIIERIQAPVKNAIDWVINKAVQLAKAAGKLFAGDKEEKPEEKSPGTDDPEHDLKVQAGLADIDSEEKRYLEAGQIEREEAEKVAATVKKRHGVFRSLGVVDGGETWDYRYEASPAKTVKGKEKEGGGGEQRVITAYHGADGDELLGIISSGKMTPSGSQIFLGRSPALFLHGGDLGRQAAFVARVKLTFDPEQVEAESTSTQGVDDTVLLSTNQDVDVEVLSIVVRRPFRSLETGALISPRRFRTKNIIGEGAILAYLSSGWQQDRDEWLVDEDELE